MASEAVIRAALTKYFEASAEIFEANVDPVTTIDGQNTYALQCDAGSIDGADVWWVRVQLEEHPRQARL